MRPDELSDSLPLLAKELARWGGRVNDLLPIAGDGSDRRYFRLRRPQGDIVCLYHPHPPGSQVTENDSFYTIGQHLRRQGAPVPEIYVYCPEEGWFLLEDLGDGNLQEEIRRLGAGPAGLELYRRALHILVQMQVAGALGFKTEWCFDTAFYDAALVRQRECHYFVRAFLQGYCGLPVDLEALAADFDHLLQQALVPEVRFFLHRDFQSRNLMVHQGRLRVIDFQGGRLGPLQYDLAALLLDPYVGLSLPLQEILLAEYLLLLRDRLDFDPDAWRQRYDYLAICRNLQMLGAYGFLSRDKGKVQFERFIPPARASLRRRLEIVGREQFPVLGKLLEIQVKE